MDFISKHPKQIHTFELFGKAHILTVLIMCVLAVFILFIAKHNKKMQQPIKMFLLLSLIIMDLAYRLWGGFYQGVDLSVFLTLHLSSASVFIAILLLLRYNQKIFDVFFYWALIAVPQAIITPGISRYGFPHLRFFHILWIHITVLMVVVYFIWVEKKRPSKNSLKTALIYTHIYAACIFVINMKFSTNYMFIGRKTSAITLIDVLGPWPVYILYLDMILITLFTILFQITRKLLKPPK